MFKAIKSGLKKAESHLQSLQTDLVILIDGDQPTKELKAIDVKKAWLSFTTQLDSHYLTGLSNQKGLTKSLHIYLRTIIQALARE